jgi:hypothetical protein
MSAKGQAADMGGCLVFNMLWGRLTAQLPDQTVRSGRWETISRSVPGSA